MFSELANIDNIIQFLLKVFFFRFDFAVSVLHCQFNRINPLFVSAMLTLYLDLLGVNPLASRLETSYNGIGQNVRDPMDIQVYRSTVPTTEAVNISKGMCPSPTGK